MADFGYAGIACKDCEIDSRAPVWIIFHAPPGLRDIRADGPAAGKLAENDTLLEIDGMDITSAKGSARYATVKPDESVKLTVRRGRATLTVTILAGLKCGPGVSPPRGVPGLMYGDIVRATTGPNADGSKRGWLGLAIVTGIRPESIATWAAHARPFSTFLVVAAVAPGGPAALAGIEVGDRLIAVNGSSLLTTEGATRFRNPTLGVPLSVEYIRSGEQHTAIIVPSAAPADPPMIHRQP